MDKNMIMKTMISEAEKVDSEDLISRNKKGYDYNIFTLLGLERQEYGIHERMIFHILNYPYNKEIRRMFIQKFMEVMELPDTYIRAEWNVEKEYATVDYGRMDLFFCSKSQNKRERKCVVVELKIDAYDQEGQLFRYENYVKTRLGIADYQILYITLDGHEASEQSIDLADIDRIRNVSYYEYVKKWLEQCVEICITENMDDSFIKQYIRLIEKLHGDDMVEKKMEGLISNKDELLAAIKLSDALPQVKAKVMEGFWKCLKREMSKLKMKLVWESDDEAISDYYRRACIPCLTYLIKDFQTGTYGKVSIVVEIYIYYRLMYCVAYYDDKNNVIKSGDFKRRQKKKTAVIEAAISSVFGTEVRENQNDEIIYKPILDQNDQSYDFKHFSQNCCNLMEEAECHSEAERIARQMAAYIKLLRKELAEL